VDAAKCSAVAGAERAIAVQVRALLLRPTRQVKLGTREEERSAGAATGKR
jgi:hypothetical protein